MSHINSLKNASREQEKLAIEASNIYALLAPLKFRMEQPNFEDSSFTAVRTLGVENGALDQLKLDLEDPSSKVDPSDGVRGIGKKLNWKSNTEGINSTLSKIERLRTLVGLALSNHLL